MLRNKNVTFTFLLPKDVSFMIHQVSPSSTSPFFIPTVGVRSK